MSAPEPVAVWRGTFTLYGVALRCYTLDDGRRVVDADDLHRLFIARAAEPERPYPPGDVIAFTAWHAGRAPEPAR